MKKTSIKKTVVNIFQWFAKMISLTVVIFFILEIVSFLIIKSLPNIAHFINTPSSRNAKHGLKEISSQIDGGSSLEAIFSDLNQIRERYNPYTVWMSGDVQSKTLNIDKRGIRKTNNPQVEKSALKDRKQIYIFGASTLFGYGADDDHTVPSFLSKIINKNSRHDYEVVNFGTPAYNSSQELNRLIAELRKNNIPDYVIFYDGIADILFGAYNPGFADGHFHYYETALSYNHKGLLNIIYSSYTFRLLGYTQEKIFSRHDQSKIVNADRKVAGVLDNYKKNVEILHALSKSFGFKYYVFFQPVLCSTKKAMTPFEKRIYDSNGVLNEIFQKAHLEIKNMDFSRYSYFNISDAFDKVNEEVYIDFMHVDASGNEIIAQTIFKHIQKDIQ